VVEVEAHRGVVRLDDRARIAARAIGRGELHHVAHGVLLVGVAHLREQLSGHPLLHVGIALAEGFAGGQLEGGMRALLQAHQALLHGGRKLAGAERQGRGLVGEGVDDVARRTGQPVVQGEKGAGIHDLGHGAADVCEDGEVSR